jgi:NAD(P)-dependent dehydrogenase (short-subunit alcohol dehydrogenase family)
MPQTLHGKTALITGASKGLGKAMAVALAHAGAEVTLVSRDETKLHEVAAQVRKNGGGSAAVIVADVTDEAQVERVRDAFAAKWGSNRLDILINNAGINIRKAITDFTLAEWNSVLKTNLTSVFLLCRAFLPMMKGKAYGRIINMTSMMSHVSLPGRTAYSASKSALLGFNRALALELAGEKITVNSISPGVCDTR